MSTPLASHELKKIKESTDFIQNKIPSKIKTAIVLGSGLGSFADFLKNLDNF